MLHGRCVLSCRQRSYKTAEKSLNSRLKIYSGGMESHGIGVGPGNGSGGPRILPWKERGLKQKVQ